MYVHLVKFRESNLLYSEGSLVCCVKIVTVCLAILS